MIIRRIPMPREPLRQGERIEYPFNLLTPQQRCWLSVLKREFINTLQQSFDALKTGKLMPHTVLGQWIDDPAFQDALNITLRRLPDSIRAEQIRDAIIRSVVCQPLREVCDLSGRCC